MSFHMYWEAWMRRSFTGEYKAFSVCLLSGPARPDVENGGKIILPPSALQTLSSLNVEYPMLFKLSNPIAGRESHAGVLEFIADEGNCYLPNWMMSNLELNDGDIIMVENVSLPIATFSKFQPFSNFLDITNPKAVLENALRNFACLTVNDTIAINYNKKIYNLRVLETQPDNAVSIIECDMNVDFETPLGDALPEVDAPVESIPEAIAANDPFPGSGTRLDGKEKKPHQILRSHVQEALARGIPDYDYVIGILIFDRSMKPHSDKERTSEDIQDSPWTGSAKTFKNYNEE